MAATTAVVPDPANRSATVSPGSLDASMIRASKLSFFCVAQPVFSREKLLIWIESSDARPLSWASLGLAFHTSSIATPGALAGWPSRRS